MGWHLLLGAELRVERDGIDCGRAPNSSVAVLLIGLAYEKRPLSRDLLSALLFPESDRPTALNALRQTLLRLRRWLGEECIVTSDRTVRLGEWMVQPSETPFMVAIDHPWLNSIREAWQATKEPATNPALQGFLTALREAAKVDLDTARALFVNGQLFTKNLSIAEFEGLLRLTRPRSGRDPFALEHLAMDADFLHHQGKFLEADASFMRGVKVASRVGRHDMLDRLLHRLAFNGMEIDQLRRSGDYLDQLKPRFEPKNRLSYLNCRATLEWNADRLQDALNTMASGVALIERATLDSQAHYWSNYAVLAAEAGQPGLSAELIARSIEMLSKIHDGHKMDNLALAQGTRLMALHENEAAIAQLSAARDKAAAERRLAGVLYFEEALGEANALAGRKTAARQNCRFVDQVRGSRLNPRVRARRRRIESLLA